MSKPSPKHEPLYPARTASLKEQAEAIRHNRELARKDYWNFGGLGYPSNEQINTLLAYIDELERKAAETLPGYGADGAR